MVLEDVMTKQIFTAIATTMILSGLLVIVPVGTAAHAAALQTAQTQVPERCAMIKDPAERAACIRAEMGR